MSNLLPKSIGPVSQSTYYEGMPDRTRPNHIDIAQDYILRTIIDPSSYRYFAREYAVTVENVLPRSHLHLPSLGRIASVKIFPLTEGSLPETYGDKDIYLPIFPNGLIANDVSLGTRANFAYGRVGYLLNEEFSTYTLPRAIESTEQNIAPRPPQF